MTRLRGAASNKTKTGRGRKSASTGARGPTQGLARHAHDKAENRPGPGIVAEEFVALRIEAGARDLDKSDVVRAAVKGKPAQAGRIYWLGLFAGRRRKPGYRRMIGKLHPWPRMMMTGGSGLFLLANEGLISYL